MAGRDIEAFISRWQGREGGQERANYALFLSELCDSIGVERPDPAEASPETNDYVFERMVREPNGDSTHIPRWIDLYKRDCFVLEAKQSRQPGGKKEIQGQSDLFTADEPEVRGRRSANRAWDVLMMNARQQAQNYARCLPPAHGWPPFILVCDIGHCIEVYADFSGQGRNYVQYPDRQGFRLYLEDLRQSKVRELLKAIWTDPRSLDPARRAARVTRQIALRLAAVSRALERQGQPANEVAMFLMRCLFTMFAQSVGLLPKRAFEDLLTDCEREPARFVPMVEQLWEAMDEGGFAFAVKARVRHFNGEFFKVRKVMELGREEIGELRCAAQHDWRDVEPAIFGTLLEQALNPEERRRLGAHYTPRAYVERLVVATVIKPLRDAWAEVMSTAERQKAERRDREAAATVRAFHERLCATRTLDPACGTGNFLYVALELMKRLEGEVLEALADLGGQEALTLSGHTVDPHQFLGIEINPRAAAIAELVLWIGYLQWHFRTKGSAPAEPILRAFHNINVMDAVLESEKDRAGIAHKIPRCPKWPPAEFIVGNPPFIGKGEPMRDALGQAYLDDLKEAHPEMKESADFVLYWWNHAANLLTEPGSVLSRFGFVTTNSITQVFNRRVVEHWLKAKKPISLTLAVPDHPWTKATPDAAAVRIAMTVCQSGRGAGVLSRVVHEAGLDSDDPVLILDSVVGEINSDLTIGADVTSAVPLRANEGLASMGPALGGRGFVLTATEARRLNPMAGDIWLKKLTTGRDITGRHRGRFAIDVRDYDSEDALRKFLPQVFQHLKENVCEARQSNNDPKLRKFWWKYRRSNDMYFKATQNLPRFIATVETAKHRFFLYVGADELLEHGVVGIGLADPWALGVLSSRQHICWALANGGTLEDRPRYNKDVCFDTFPFPAATDAQR